MPERFANNAFTTLNESGGIDDNTNPVTFTVSNPAAFPASGNFRIKIDDEILLVTGVSGNDFTATRGVEGSPITEHYNGVGIRHIITAVGLKQAFDDRFMSGTYASLPAAGVAGRKYYCTDSVYTMVDTGSEWLHLIDDMIVTPPVLADFTWVNQDTATAVDTYGGIYMETTVGLGNQHNHMSLVKTAPNTPYSIVLGLMPYMPSTAFGLCGGVWRNSSSGNFSTIRHGTENGGSFFYQFMLEHFNSPNSANGFAYLRNFQMGSTRQPIYVKFTDDGVDRKIFYSSNPNSFPLEYHSVVRTNHITPNQVGIHINNYSQPQRCHFVHWKEGS